MHAHSDLVVTKPLPFCTGVVHRACPSCGAANPSGLSHCSMCGTEAPIPFEFNADAVFGWSLWFPVFLIRCGEFFAALSRKIAP